MAKIDRIEDWNISITDINMYLGIRDCHRKEVDMTELIRIMDHFRITHAACTHDYCLVDPKHGNVLMKEEAAKTGGRVGVTVFIDPSLGQDCLPGDGGLYERLRDFAPEAVRIAPSDRAVFSAFYWDEVLDAVNRLKLPLIIDSDYSSDFMIKLPEVAAEYKDIKFILVHYGLCRSRHIFPLIKKCSNVYFTIESMLDNLQVEEICERGGADKLLFGSGYPKFSPSGALGLGLYADISDEDREKIMYKNWEVIKG